MQRRHFLKAAGLTTLMPVIAACSGGTTTPPGTDPPVTVQTIIDFLKTGCGFETDAQNIINVIISFVSGFNPALGAGAAVAASVAKTAEDMICAAVNVFKAQAAAQGTHAAVAPSSLITVTTANGVKVKGTLK